MPNYRPVIIQADNSYPPTAKSSSPASKYLIPSGLSDTSTYIKSSSSSSSSQSNFYGAPSQPTAFVSSSRTRPAQVAGEYPHGQQEFVYTGRPQGGNPNGGPRQNPEGYTRISTGNVTVHNSGGLCRGQLRVRLAQEYANGPEHTRECQDTSRWSDNQGLCFCPPRTN